MEDSRQSSEHGRNRRVLMISHDFPPMGTPGALRAAKHAGYLPKFGWTPQVVTCLIGSNPSTGLERYQPPDSVRVERARDWKRMLKGAKPAGKPSTAGNQPSLSPGAKRGGLLASVATKLFFPDREITWAPSAYSAAARLARSESLELVYSSALPMSNHLVAGRIARRFRLPWVAEFRDLWALAWEGPRESLTQKLRKRCERAVVRDADRVVVVTDNQRVAMREAYPQWRDKFVVIRNGYDPDDVRDITPSPPRDRLVLNHSGILYGGDRNTAPLLHAIARLKGKGVLTPERFQLDFVGVAEPHLLKQIEDNQVSDLVRCSPRVPYQESLNQMATCSAVLVVVHSSEVGQGWVPIKFYEAMGVRRPVLALVKRGYELAGLVEELGAGAVVDPDDATAIEAWLAGEMERLERGQVLESLPADAVLKYSREQRSAELAGLFDELTASPRR